MKKIAECQLLKLPTAPRYWIKLTNTYENENFPITKGMFRNGLIDHEMTSFKICPRSRQLKLNKPLLIEKEQS